MLRLDFCATAGYFPRYVSSTDPGVSPDLGPWTPGLPSFRAHSERYATKLCDEKGVRGSRRCWSHIVRYRPVRVQTISHSIFDVGKHHRNDKPLVNATSGATVLELHKQDLLCRQLSEATIQQMSAAHLD